MSLWNILNNITFNKKDNKDEINFKSDYNSFMINRGLSYFPDTIMYANEVNLLSDLDDDIKYDYLINSIRPRKRFSKWAKKTDDKNLKLVMEYYNYNIEKARSALLILNESDLENIKQKMNRGG